ncbi:MAG: FliO/MopB family protein [Rhodospirillaceae bacterium]|nr:FliO/MopB family protein [Rhodospirillaceae bacterium]
MEMATYLRFVLALVFVLALIGVVAWLIRRFGLAGARPTGRSHRRDRRLALIEVLPIDARRRVILLRRDRVEHLVLLGPSADVVIESIPAGDFGTAVAEAAEADASDDTAEPQA